MKRHGYRSRRRPAGVLIALALACAAAMPPPPAVAGSESPYPLVRQLMSGNRKERRAAAETLARTGDRALVAPLVDAIFFTPRIHRSELLGLLEDLTGERSGDYYDWVEYVGAHPEPPPPEGYLGWKMELLGLIDPEYRKILYPSAPTRIRVEEIVSGGVRVAGIPALDDPPTMPAAEAGYLRDGELVFGAVVGGEARAYPLRILSWHEMVNDVVGGEPITLSFCTLCGSGILYSTRTPAGGKYLFDTSGLLYRSNKLMLDRQSYSLWSNLTGEPVVGRLAASPIRLEMLPSTVTTWEDWRRRHPASRVLDLKEIERLTEQRFGFDYRPGAADRARRGVSFPVWLKSDALERDAEVFTLRVEGRAKAYPLDLVLRARVVNDDLGGQPLVIVGDPASGAVRAYERGERRFRAGADGSEVVDETGGRWRVEEGGLRPPSGDLAPLDRVAGHLAFWFGWYAFYPDTEVYTVGEQPGG